MQQNYQGWEEVPEEQIVEAISMAENTPGTGADSMNFKKILIAGKVFKDAGLTPVYVWDDNTHRLAVYAQELYMKKLH